MVIWIIGMSSSGKTTLGREMMKFLKISGQPWEFLDGDAFRHKLGEDLGHTVQDRRKNAERISQYCLELDKKGINVLACVLSIFHDNQRYNREHFSSYREVYMEVDLEKLMERDNKGLYAKAKRGEIPNVVGVDIPFVPPYAPDLVLDNNSDDVDHSKNAVKVLEHFGLPVMAQYPFSSRNLLKQPETYQYTPYWGQILLDRYTASRQEALASIGGKGKGSSSKQPVNLSAKELPTRSFLVGTALKLQRNEKLNTPESEIVQLLLKRFEVSKKIYASYSLPDVKRSSDVHDDALPYAAFAFVLGEFCASAADQFKKAIYFNALLKINDLLTSVLKEGIEPEASAWLRLALEREQQVYQQFQKVAVPC